MTGQGASRPFDAVLCDLDGVVRFFDHREVARLERAAGLPAGAAFRAAFRPGVGDRLVLGALDRVTWTAALADGLAPLDAERAGELARAFAHSPAWADETAVALLRRARAHVPVLLVTNATVWLEEDLAALGLTDLADQVVNSARVGLAKPDPALYHLAADRVGLAPDRCLFVDDSPKNVAAAAGLGMRAVLHRTPADLATALADLWS
ncbi:hydrolase [Kitasatospora sp. MMS16-BH015]|uniref:HAD family hydrolase n=1 Tax=Kitasatospora sp. MMS16-BH015 TaxID=2018025 RepID=UPI000CA3AC8C|nr:hydrolase [Kitasatospora sp. MMS16-BH015]